MWGEEAGTIILTVIMSLMFFFGHWIGKKEGRREAIYEKNAEFIELIRRITNVK